ncbi:MAG: succinate--CoA ligase [Spirochaetaceae bacterium]|nr:MAG: succinate--CoA ligase [Spirochaetaceae bacterium]
MKLFEFQGKELFAGAGIPVPASRLVRISEPDGTGVPGGIEGVLARVQGASAELAREVPGLRNVVIKAQLDMGGRGKAGLIRVAPVNGTGPDGADSGATGAAGTVAREILDKGYTIPALLIEEAAQIGQELYLSISAEPGNACYVILASAEGGVDIEELARTRPEAIRRVQVDPFRGLQGHQSRGLAYDLGLTGPLVGQFARLVEQLWSVFTQYEAELAEINPVFVTDATGAPGLIAGDAKVIIDDNSLGRLNRAGHGQFQLTREQYDSDAAYESALEGIPYVQFDGDISLMCAGAGLTTTVFDLVNYEGGSVANYLEFGGPNYNKAQRAMELCLKNRSSVILIVTFGTIARADVMAEGVVTAIGNLKPDRPIVTCIRGTGEEEADRTLRTAGLEPLYDTEEAVRRAVALAASAREGVRS